MSTRRRFCQLSRRQKTDAIIIHTYPDDHAIISSCGHLKRASRTLITDHSRLRLKLNTVIRPPDDSREVLYSAVELVDSHLPNHRTAHLQKYIGLLVVASQISHKND